MLNVNINSNSSWICLLIFSAVCRVYPYLSLPCPPSLLRIPSVLWSIWLLLGHKIAFLAPGVEPVTDCQVVLRTGSVTSGSVAIQNVSNRREWPMFGHSVWQSLCCLDQNRWTHWSRMLPAETFLMRKRLLTLSVAKPRQNAEAILKICELCIYGYIVSDFEPRWEARFSAPVESGTGAHPASRITGTGSFPRLKRPE